MFQAAKRRSSERNDIARPRVRRTTKVKARIALILALAAASLPAQSADADRSLEVLLEKRDGVAWAAVEPGEVLANGDQIRFKVKPDFAGRLYVLNRASTGRAQVLFPTSQAGAENRLAAGEEITLPQTEGAFSISGPPGYEVIYWVAAPPDSELADPAELRAMLDRNPPKLMAGGVAPPRLTPRCDDAILRSRSVCVDSGAGVRRLDASVEEQNASPLFRARGVTVGRRDKAAVIQAAPAANGHLLFEYRIAHR